MGMHGQYHQSQVSAHIMSEVIRLETSATVFTN